jgi:hypothetical protein
MGRTGKTAGASNHLQGKDKKQAARAEMPDGVREGLLPGLPTLPTELQATPSPVFERLRYVCVCNECCVR